METQYQEIEQSVNDVDRDNVEQIEGEFYEEEFVGDAHQIE